MITTIKLLDYKIIILNLIVLLKTKKNSKNCFIYE